MAKWLCQKSAIFSWSGRLEWTIRKSQRCRASVMFSAGRNAAACRDPDSPRLADQVVDVVFLVLVVDELVDRGAETDVGELIDLRLAGAEAGTPQEVLDRLLPTPWHGTRSRGRGELENAVSYASPPAIGILPRGSRADYRIAGASNGDAMA